MPGDRVIRADQSGLSLHEIAPYRVCVYDRWLFTVTRQVTSNMAVSLFEGYESARRAWNSNRESYKLLFKLPLFQLTLLFHLALLFKFSLLFQLRCCFNFCCCFNLRCCFNFCYCFNLLCCFQLTFFFQLICCFFNLHSCFDLHRCFDLYCCFNWPCLNFRCCLN